jgi:SNF2 family DNA or RNA helicase
VHDFQHDPAVRVFFGQIDAAGEMLTLTAANTVVIAEAEFVPTVVAQAAKRAHRIGQTQPVLVHLLVAPNTLDARIAAACARKAAELSQMFDDDAASREVTHDA